MATNITSILNLLKLAERLKFEMRHSWLSNGRRESVAEHSWQMALMALIVHRYLDEPVNLEHALKMILVHDLVEAEARDIPFFETGPRKEQKQQREQEAIEKIRAMVDIQLGQEIYDLFQEFERAETGEARLAKALDNLEVQIQHNQADFSTWEEAECDLVYTKIDDSCAHDTFLRDLCEAVKAQAEEKMQENGVDITAVKQRVIRPTNEHKE